MNRVVSQTLLKKVLLEMCFFGIVVIASASALASLSPVYKAKMFMSEGSTDLALISVPVPIEAAMEGKKVQYTVSCTMKNGALECVEGK